MTLAPVRTVRGVRVDEFHQLIHVLVVDVRVEEGKVAAPGDEHLVRQVGGSTVPK